jgi:hypothetical protein
VQLACFVSVDGPLLTFELHDPGFAGLELIA